MGLIKKLRVVKQGIRRGPCLSCNVKNESGGGEGGRPRQKGCLGKDLGITEPLGAAGVLNTKRRSLERRSPIGKVLAAGLRSGWRTGQELPH